MNRHFFKGKNVSSWLGVNCQWARGGPRGQGFGTPALDTQPFTFTVIVTFLMFCKDSTVAWK